MTPAARVLTYLAVSGDWHTIGQLATALGLPRRAVEEAIQELRLAENPIASGSRRGQRGVRLVHTAEELAVSNRVLGHRLKEQHATLEAQQRAEARLRAREAVRAQWPAWDVAS